MCFVELMLLIFGLGLMFRGRLHLGSASVGKPYAAMAGGCLAAPLVLSGALWVGSWVFSFLFMPHYGVTSDYQTVSLNPGGLSGTAMFIVDILLVFLGLAGAGLCVVIGVLAADPKEKAAATRAPVSQPPLFHDQAVRAGMTCQSRHYLLGRAVGQTSRWKELAEELAQSLQECNTPQPRINWNIRLLDASAAVEMNLNALQMRTLAEGRFPVVYVKFVYDGEMLKPNKLEELEQKFDLRPLSS
jgi:hypothetical protein